MVMCVVRVRIFVTWAAFFSLTVPVHSAGGGAHLSPMPSSSAETQEPISPTTGAAISTLLSISLGSISIWMNFCVPGLPQDLPLPCDSSQLRRAPISRSEEHTSELQSLMRTQYAVF